MRFTDLMLPFLSKLRAVREAMAPEIKTERITAGPVKPADIPVTTKIPAPTIAPIPIEVASKTFSVLFSSIASLIENSQADLILMCISLR